MNPKKKILTGMVVLGIILTLTNIGGLAYFFDIEESKTNTFEIAETWSQSDNLDVDNQNVWVSGHSSNNPQQGGFHNVTFSNKGGKRITVEAIEISWEKNSGEQVTKAFLTNRTPPSWWTGSPSEPSGSILVGDPITIFPENEGGSEYVMDFYFDNDMREKENFTLRFIMEDSSTKTVKFKPDTGVWRPPGFGNPGNGN